MITHLRNRDFAPLEILPGPRVLIGGHAYPVPAEKGLALAGQLARESFRGIAEEVIREDDADAGGAEAAKQN